MREPVGREPIDDAEGVAELVVEAGPDDSRRQGGPHIGHLLADLVPGVGYGGSRCAPLEVHEDRRGAGSGEAAQVVDVRHLLQRSLQPLRDLLQRVVECCARPRRLHHHAADGEGGVLAAAEPRVGEDARHDGRDHEEDDDRTVSYRPLGKVESGHGRLPSKRTSWPGRRAWTPAVTTMSSGSSPPATTTFDRS